MKLSKQNLQIVSELQEQIEHHALIIARKKANCRYLPEWFKEKTIEWHEGAQGAAAGALSNILMKHNCYTGFNIRKEKSEQFNVEYEYELYYLNAAKG